MQEWSPFDSRIYFGHPYHHREFRFLLMRPVTISPQIFKATFPTMERPKDTILRRFSRVVDSSLTSFFGAIAERVAVRPYAVITVMTLLSLLAGAGVVRIKVLTDTEKLYTPQGTQGFSDQVGSEPLYIFTPLLYLLLVIEYYHPVNCPAIFLLFHRVTILVFPPLLCMSP